MRRRRGFTLVEVVAAAGLVALLVLMVAAALDSMSSTFRHLTTKARAQSEARAGMDAVVRSVRGARPLGACRIGGDVRRDVALDDCRRVAGGRVGEAGAALEEAAADRVVLYAYAAPDDRSGPVALRPPDRVEVSVTADGRLQLKRWAATAAATYTNPAWPATPTLVREIGVVATREVFSFFTADGDELPFADGRLAAEDLGRVALVRAAPTFTYRRGQARVEANAATFTLETFVALSGDRLGREDCFTGDRSVTVDGVGCGR